jgi:O-antigen ligase
MRIAFAGAAIVGVGMLFTAPPARDGIARAVDDVKEFFATAPDNRGQIQTSVGMRLRFWTVASHVFLESPSLGSSVSDYRSHYLAQDAALGNSVARTGNPHCEYLYVAGALGLVGLATYLAVYIVAFLSAMRLRLRTQANIATCYLASAAVCSLANSLAIDMIPGHFHALALLLLLMFDW